MDTAISPAVELEAMIEAKLAELQETHPDAEIVETAGRPDLAVIMRPPNPQEWRRVKELVYDPKTRTDGNRQIVNDTVLWPDPTGVEFRRLASRYPAWIDSLGSAASNLAGASLEVSIRKR